MAEGRSNAAIAQRLFITEKAVSKHDQHVHQARAGIAGDDNRRLLAVLANLNA